MTVAGLRGSLSRGLRMAGTPHAGVSLLLTLVLIVVIFLLMASTIGPHAGGLGDNLTVLVTFAIAVVIAEQLRMGLPGRLETAPMVTAIGMAMAFATERSGERITYTAGGCVLAVGLAIALGVIPRHVRGIADPTADALDTVVRLFSVTLAAVIWRAPWPFLQGDPLVEVSRAWSGWQTASALIVLGMAVTLAETPIRAARRAVQEQMRWLQATRDETVLSAGLGAAVTATATMMAICLPVLDAFAIPLIMLPMLFTQMAVRRQSATRETYRQTVTALSRMPEVVGIIPRGHAATVAHLSVGVGRQLGMKEREVNDLEFAALLHDIGQVTLRYPIPGGATVQAAPVDQQRIADDGASIVRETGVLGSVADVIAAQAAPYRRVVEGHERLPVSSRILKVTNAYADYYAAHADIGEAPEQCRAAALERIYLGLGYQFDPAVVNALEQTLGRLE